LGCLLKRPKHPGPRRDSTLLERTHFVEGALPGRQADRLRCRPITSRSLYLICRQYCLIPRGGLAKSTLTAHANGRPAARRCAVTNRAPSMSGAARPTRRLAF